jgi:hypothetical protein
MATSTWERRGPCWECIRSWQDYAIYAIGLLQITSSGSSRTAYQLKMRGYPENLLKLYTGYLRSSVPVDGLSTISNGAGIHLCVIASMITKEGGSRRLGIAKRLSTGDR